MTECSSLFDYTLMKKLQALSKKEKKSLLEKTVKLQEESGELAEAVLSFRGASGSLYKQKKQESIQEEAVDVLLVAISIFFSEGGTMDELSNLLHKKAGKWEKFQSK